MALGQMHISPDIEDKLGEDGLAEVAVSLWPVDCQTCGEPLGPLAPALYIHDMGAIALASLHHEQCRSRHGIKGRR
jgi:hypothetical protein